MKNKFINTNQQSRTCLPKSRECVDVGGAKIIHHVGHEDHVDFIIVSIFFGQHLIVIFYYQN